MATPRRRRGRGGKGGHEPRLRIREREHTVVHLSTEGRSQHDIARSVGISQAAVWRILARVDDRWLRENLRRVGQQKVELDRKFQHLYAEALTAFHASKAEHTRRRHRKTHGSDPEDEGTMAEVIVDDSHGDPRFLETARRILADRQRLWVPSARTASATDADVPA